MNQRERRKIEITADYDCGEPQVILRKADGEIPISFANTHLKWLSSKKPASGAISGISIDEQTALLIGANANATVVGISTVYFLQAPGAPQVCQAGTPLTCQNTAIYRINSTGTFNLSTWNGTGGVSYTVSANAGVLSSTQSGGSIY